jgi:thioredoxin 1
MAPVLQELETESNGGLKVVKVDASVEGMLAAEYGVRAVPTFLLFSNGQCLGQTIGMKSKTSMKTWFDESLKTVA